MAGILEGIKSSIQRLFSQTKFQPRQVVRKDICTVCGVESNCTAVAPQQGEIESESDRGMFGEVFWVCDSNPYTKGTCMNQLIASNPKIKFDYVKGEEW